MNESAKPRTPTTDELRAAIIAANVDGCAPSIAIFKSRYCNSDNPDRLISPASLCKAYGQEETAAGWAALCRQVAGLESADRAYYMSYTYDAAKRSECRTQYRAKDGRRPAHPQPTIRRRWIPVLRYFPRYDVYARTTMPIEVTVFGD